MSDNEKGLYDKYTVINNKIGKPIQGPAFILRPDRDNAALKAIEAYAEATSNEKLSQDLKDWIKHLKWERGDHVSAYEKR